MSTSSPPTSTPTPLPLLPLLLPYLSKALHFITHLTTRLVAHIPWTALFAPIAYLLAPLTTFASILLTLTLFTPYHFITWLLEVAFPVYVFCGVACITGSILGFGGRLVSLGIVAAVSEENVSKEGAIAAVKDDDDPEVVERSAKRRKLGRKERDGRVKFEPSGWYTTNQKYLM